MLLKAELLLAKILCSSFVCLFILYFVFMFTVHRPNRIDYHMPHISTILMSTNSCDQIERILTIVLVPHHSNCSTGVNDKDMSLRSSTHMAEAFTSSHLRRIHFLMVFGTFQRRIWRVWRGQHVQAANRLFIVVSERVSLLVCCLVRCDVIVVSHFINFSENNVTDNTNQYSYCNFALQLPIEHELIDF